MPQSILSFHLFSSTGSIAQMIDILKKFLNAERLGNWDLHLEATSKMLPYYAATGHNLYLKSANLYLDKMLRLPEEHPDVYQQFKEGLHVVKRSDRQWGGLSSDLIIEQVLMQSLKTSGGLTRGRGMNEQQRTIWDLSTPICANINHLMQEISGVIHTTGEQNRDIGASKTAWDWKDTCTIAQFLKTYNPFECEGIIVHIANGVYAGS